MCQNYTKTYIYKILYKNLRFKQIISSKYTTHLKTTIFQKSLKNSGLLLIFEFNIFSFLIDIIYNINESSVLRDQNSHQWQYSIFVTWYRRRHVNMILHCHWSEFCSRDTYIKFPKKMSPTSSAVWPAITIHKIFIYARRALLYITSWSARHTYI